MTAVVRQQAVFYAPQLGVTVEGALVLHLLCHHLHHNHHLNHHHLWEGGGKEGYFNQYELQKNHV